MDDKKKIGFEYVADKNPPLLESPSPEKSNTSPEKKTETPAPSVKKESRHENLSVDNALGGVIRFIGQIVGYVTTGIIEISVIALDAVLSSGNRGFQALAGVGASLGYYASLRYTWILMASMDPGVGLSTMLGLTIEFAKIVLSYLGWGRANGNKYFKALAIVAICMSIFATMSYSKNANNKIRIETTKGTDKYAAQQAQRESLLQELATINTSITNKEQAASDARANADAAATKVSTVDPDIKANALEAKKAKDDQANEIQKALDARIASYSPAWIAKNASEVSKWREQARTDIAALRTAGVKVYDEMTKAKDYDTAKNEVLGNASALESQAKDLRARKDTIIATLGTAEGADNTQRYTSGYLAVFEAPKSNEEWIELFVNLFFSVFLELFSAALVKAYKDFGDETSSLFGTALDFAAKLRGAADKLRSPNGGLVTASYDNYSPISKASNLEVGKSESLNDWVSDSNIATEKADRNSSAGKPVTKTSLLSSKQPDAKESRFKGVGSVDLADVQRYATHISTNATQNKNGEFVAPGIRSVAKDLKMSAETAKKVHWYLSQHGRISVDEKAKRTYIPQ